MVDRKREKVLNVRLDEHETRMVAALAELDGLNVSDWVRRTIRVAFRDAFPVEAGPLKRAKK